MTSSITGFSTTSSTAEQLVSGYLTEDLQRRVVPPPADPDREPGPR